MDWKVLLLEGERGVKLSNNGRVQGNGWDRFTCYSQQDLKTTTAAKQYLLMQGAADVYDGGYKRVFWKLMGVYTSLKSCTSES